MTQLSNSSIIDNTIILPGRAWATFPYRNATLIKQRYKLVSFDLIRAALTQKLGFKPKRIRPVREGKGSCLYLIENEQERCLVMKIGLFHDHHNPAHEFLFNTIVTSNNIDTPVPETYVLDLSAELMPCPYSILEWLPGKSLLNLTSAGSFFELEKSLELVGGSIRLIHDIKHPTLGYGNLTSGCVNEFISLRMIPHPLCGIDKTIFDHYVRPANEAVAYLFDFFVINEKDRSSVNLLMTTEVPEQNDIVIQHGDMSMGNFMINQNRLTGILDGSAKIGFRFEELADAYVFICSLAFHFPYFSPDEAFRAFLRGYGIEYKKVIKDRNYRFFLITKLVSHIKILFDAKRLKYIPDYLELLRKYY